jgi:hypothetical protein
MLRMNLHFHAQTHRVSTPVFLFDFRSGTGHLVRRPLPHGTVKPHCCVIRRWVVARGLQAVANRQEQQPLITVEHNVESLTLDAFAAFVTYKNFAKALELASKAAEQGHAHAYYVLGFIYSFGGDGEGDYVLAFMWDTLAVKY